MKSTRLTRIEPRTPKTKIFRHIKAFFVLVYESISATRKHPAAPKSFNFRCLQFCKAKIFAITRKKPKEYCRISRFLTKLVRKFALQNRTGFYFRKPQLKILAILIEYHWWRVERLQKKTCHEKNESTLNREDFHKFRAKQLMVLYEMFLGLRDFCGNIVA